jgi:dihydrofolate reductase
LRKLTYAINISIDGCCDHTKGSGSAEVLKYYTDLVGKSDLFLYGRKTYQLMVPYWPEVAKDKSASKSEKEFAEAFNSVSKVVFSKTLSASREEKETRIVRGNLKNEVLKLKKQSGGTILTGGVSLPSQLIALGLVDQLNVVVNPILVGDGRRLLEGFSLDRELKLVDSKRFKSGSVLLRYLKK